MHHDPTLHPIITTTHHTGLALRLLWPRRAIHRVPFRQLHSICRPSMRTRSSHPPRRLTIASETTHPQSHPRYDTLSRPCQMVAVQTARLFPVDTALTAVMPRVLTANKAPVAEVVTTPPRILS
jgi:hypothetical protein